MLTSERIRELWENYSPTQGIESFARAVEAEARHDAERLFWESCQPHGKVGEVVYTTYKAKRDSAKGDTHG